MRNATLCLVVAGLTGGAFALPAAAQNQGVEEIVVTGTYIRRQSQLDAPSPLLNVTRDDLAATGYNDIGRVIQRLTINTGSENNTDAFTQNTTTGTSNINLRGLGVASTLVLVNGRRQGPSSYRKIGSQTTIDAQYSLRLKAEKAPTLAFGAINMLDESPPHVQTNGGFDSKVADPRGRLYYVKADFRF
jgi:outer membrane receptor for ferrienterochelin and colicin